MTFMPGKSGNPKGRPKNDDLPARSYQAFYKQNQGKIHKVGEIVLKKALEDEEPWALKLCMQHYYPIPGRSVAMSKEETTSVNMTVTRMTEALSWEDQRTFLRLLRQTQKGIPAFRTSSEVTTEGALFAGDELMMVECEGQKGADNHPKVEQR